MTSLDEQNQWRPIDTAPAGDVMAIIDIWNGERIPDVYWGMPTYPSAEEKRSGPGWVYDCGYDSEGPITYFVNPPPTHWIPLPQPPEQTGGDDADA